MDGGWGRVPGTERQARSALRGATAPLAEKCSAFGVGKPAGDAMLRLGEQRLRVLTVGAGVPGIDDPRVVEGGDALPVAAEGEVVERRRIIEDAQLLAGAGVPD